MKKIIFFKVLILISFLGNSQNKKQLKELYRHARDSGTANYIILKSKEKKEIKEIDIYRGGRGAGKAILTNGEKLKFIPGDILECQDEDAFYKLCTYDYPVPGSSVSGENLAKRLYKAAINIYMLSVTYFPPFQRYPSGTYFYLVEANNDGILIVLKNGDETIKKIKQIVSRSKKAKSIIVEDIESKYGKVKDFGYAESKLLEAVEVYNKDAEANQLEL